MFRRDTGAIATMPPGGAGDCAGGRRRRLTGGQIVPIYPAACRIGWHQIIGRIWPAVADLRRWLNIISRKPAIISSSVITIMAR